jgi:carbonic anhydrase
MMNIIETPLISSVRLLRGTKKDIQKYEDKSKRLEESLKAQALLNEKHNGFKYNASNDLK